MRTSTFLSLVGSASVASATIYKGFNYGNTFTDGTIKVQDDFEKEFKAAANLVGTSGFTSARLYTMIQGGTDSLPIEAIPAAIATNTSLLLGIWASGGQTGVTSEIKALTAAASKYGTQLAPLIAGLSIGSEDLYRVSPTGIENQSGVGAGPDEIVSYIGQVKDALAGTAWSGIQIGHVDTWNAWTDPTNKAVIDAIDWLGVDEYPYYQNTDTNSIDNAYTLFWTAFDAVKAVSGKKPVWITETGWPIADTKKENQAVPGLANAKTYWDQVGCASAFGVVNTWWYVLQDAAPTAPDPSFGILGSTANDASLGTKPLYDLSCDNVSLPASLKSTSSTSAPSSTGTGTTGTTPTGSSGSPSTTAGANGGSQTSSTTGSSATPTTSKSPSAGTTVLPGSFLAMIIATIACLL